MATEGIAYWLERKVAEALNTVGYIPFFGIIRQTAPDYRPEIGDLLYGQKKLPFISVSSVLAETFQYGPGTNIHVPVVRPVTVALIADKIVVERDDTPWKRFRELAMQAQIYNRFRGNITGIAGACVMQATVRPKSQVELSAWVNHAKWVSAFDVLIETREPVL